MSEVVGYENIENAYRVSQQQIKSKENLAQVFQAADIYLNRTYLDNFSSAQILPATSKIMNVSTLRIIKISKLVFDADEKFNDKLISVYSALHNLNSPVALIIRGNKEAVDFYVGIRCSENSSTEESVLASTLRGNFPGIVFDIMGANEIKKFINEIKSNNIKSLSSVSVVPSLRNKETVDRAETFVQGMEKFVDTMAGKEYTMLCLATPLNKKIMQERKHGYEELCSALSSYSKLTVSYGINKSEAVNESISKNFSKSVSHSISNSNSTSNSSTWGYSSGSSSSSGSSWEGFSSNSGMSSSSSSSYTSSSTFSKSVSDTEGINEGITITDGKTLTLGTTNTMTMNFENNGVLNLIDRVKMQLQRFQKCESFGMWEFSGYFMSKDISTTVLSGNSYMALMMGDESNTESAHFNIWSSNSQTSINNILDNILYFNHPCAKLSLFNDEENMQLVTPTNLINGNELPMVMGFPKKSVAGLPVVEMAEFGRTVVYENKPPKRSISFGNIYHMGVTEIPKVNFDLDLLSSHCFITGSSGSGKSYTTYHLLDSLLDNNIKIMVIEPAKGEYKQIFGGLNGIKVYTTDSNIHRMLKINPFQFPDNVHLLSHIEQLMQIFNASWSLTAAMPAILKEAVVKSYVNCGWDTQNSIWIPGICEYKYPTFKDILEILSHIIDNSDYSSEVKGNYKGSLITRVKSMTVGINGEIFKNNIGISDKVLFDSNVIVDLSELGSDEAIALIMGVLIMKLNEYRKSQRKSNINSFDSNLKHVTVLEEAHNLLKRTSKEQSQEGANLVGKSVEMISNSIKEMRTYGEGFIIIDQSPMAVDLSAIENTSTKIIMNTPSREACEELGSALSLDNIQTRELSRLNVGVAAAFQKGWLTPVLMKVNNWENKHQSKIETIDVNILKILKGELLTEIIKQKYEKKFLPFTLKKIIKDERFAEISDDKKSELIESIKFYNNRTENQTLSDSDYGNFILTLAGCQNLFSVIPIRDIPTQRDKSYGSYEEKRADIKNKCNKWLDNFRKALMLYFTVDNSKIKNDIMLELILATINNEKEEMRCNKFLSLHGILFNNIKEGNLYD